MFCTTIQLKIIPNTDTIQVFFSVSETYHDQVFFSRKREKNNCELENAC